jgi:hypothetical protein
MSLLNKLIISFALLSFLYINIACSGQQKATNTSVAAPVAQDTIDRGWPRTVTLPDAVLSFHQPQITDWEDYIYLKGWVAVEVIPKDKSMDTFYGSVNVKVQTETDFDERTVLLFNKEILEAKFDGSHPAIEKQISEEIKALQTTPEVISLDRLLPMLASLDIEEEEIKISQEAPPIFYSSENAVLVIIDGEPILAPIENTSLKFAVNTNWSLFFETESNTYYLLNEDQWLKSADLNNAWEPVSKLPDTFSKLPDEENWTDVREQIPAKNANKKLPKVYVSNKPAELILLEGTPKYETIKEAKGMSFIVNTESDLFLYGGTDSQYYLLLSGRWFKSASLDGPWSFTSNDLPPAFAQIPEDHPKGHILASVPGTQQASEAALQAKIPQTAEVSKDTKAPEVTYEGDPEFEEIKETEMTYAKNSEYDIIYLDNSYYLCYQGAWFVSPYPTYGWVVASSIPSPIYGIPAHYPCHHVTYVRVYGYGSSYVRYGYTAGYMGVYVSYGVPMYGTGYYYNPYYYYGSRYPYPVYRPYHYSYGCHARYNPYTGAYARSARAYGPYGGVGRGASYNPRTGTYARGRSAWGPGGYAGAGHAYNPRTGARGAARTAQGRDVGRTQAGGYNPRTGRAGATQQGYNPYSSWGNSAVTKNGEWAKTGHYKDKNGTRYGYETSKGGKGAGYQDRQGNNVVAGKTKKGDIYAGKNGNVYKKDGNDWKERNGNKWNDVPKSDRTKPQGKATQDQKNQAKDRANNAQKNRDNTQPKRTQPQNNRNQQTKPKTQRSPQQQLNRDYNSRQRGNQRSQNYNNYQKSRGSGSNNRSRSGSGRRRRG